MNVRQYFQNILCKQYIVIQKIVYSFIKIVYRCLKVEITGWTNYELIKIMYEPDASYMILQASIPFGVIAVKQSNQ